MTAPLAPGFHREADGRLRPPSILGDAALDQHFWSEGFVHRPLLSEEELADLGSRFRQLEPHDGFDPSTIEDARCSYHCTFLDPDRGYRRAADQLVRDVFAEKLKTILPGYTILSSNIYVKPPGMGRFEIHQNWPTLEELDIPTLTAWVPLQDTNFGNGTIRLVRGSHHVFPDVSAASSDKFFDDFQTELIDNYLEPVDVAAGEALVFDDSLLHWSGANRSDRPRVTFQIELIPDDTQAILWIRNPGDPTLFDLWEIDKEYWIEYPMESVYGTPEGLPSAGQRPNPNRRITFEEFEDNLRRRQEIRRSKYVLD